MNKSLQSSQINTDQTCHICLFYHWMVSKKKTTYYFFPPTYKAQSYPSLINKQCMTFNSLTGTIHCSDLPKYSRFTFEKSLIIWETDGNISSLIYCLMVTKYRWKFSWGVWPELQQLCSEVYIPQQNLGFFDHFSENMNDNTNFFFSFHL